MRFRVLNPRWTSISTNTFHSFSFFPIPVMCLAASGDVLLLAFDSFCFPWWIDGTLRIRTEEQCLHREIAHTLADFRQPYDGNL